MSTSGEPTPITSAGQYVYIIGNLTSKSAQLPAEPFQKYLPRLQKACEDLQEFIYRVQEHAAVGSASSGHRNFHDSMSLSLDHSPSSNESNSHRQEEDNLYGKDEDDDDEDEDEDDEEARAMSRNLRPNHGSIDPQVAEEESLRMHAAHVLKVPDPWIPRLDEVIADIRDRAPNYLLQGDRIAHLDPIAEMQRARAKGPEKAAIKRMRLVLACISLCKDFVQFEKNTGWHPAKHELTVSKLQAVVDGRANLRDFKLPKLTGHLSNFSSSLAIANKNLSTGIRLGSKLLLVESMTDMGLALLVGFECHRIHRMPHKAFVELKRMYDLSPEFSTLRTYCRNIAGWFKPYMDAYHNQNKISSFATRSVNNAAPARASLPLPSQMTHLHSTPRRDRRTRDVYGEPESYHTHGGSQELMESSYADLSLGSPEAHASGYYFNAEGQPWMHQHHRG